MNHLLRAIKAKLITAINKPLLHLLLLQLADHLYRCLMTCTDWLFRAVHSGARRNQLPSIDEPLIKLSALKLAQLIRTREVSCAEVVAAFIRRIQKVDRVLNCVAEDRFEMARRDAEKVDGYLANCSLTVDQIEIQLPLLGVPFTVKQSLAVKGMLHTVGMHSRRSLVAAKDCHVVEMMKQSGAVLLALTNTSEACLSWDSANTTNGRTKNAYDHSRSAGGSSAGEAALIAAAGAPIGIGSDFSGSIRLPCFFNGVFGLKISPNKVFNDGHWPSVKGQLNSFLVVGPMAKYSEDIDLVYSVLTQPINRPIQLAKNQIDIKSITFCQLRSSKRVRFSAKVCEELKSAQEALVKRIEKDLSVKIGTISLQHLDKQLHFWIQRMRTDPDYTTANQVLGIEDTLVAALREMLKSLVGLSNFTLSSTLVAVIDKLLKDNPDSLNQFESARAELDRRMGDNCVLLYPTHPTLAPFSNQPLVNIFNVSYTAIFNVLEMPVVQVPLGLSVHGVPQGVQIAAGRGRDQLCLCAAHYIERLSGGWIPPG